MFVSLASKQHPRQPLEPSNQPGDPLRRRTDPTEFVATTGQIHHWDFSKISIFPNEGEKGLPPARKTDRAATDDAGAPPPVGLRAATPSGGAFVPTETPSEMGSALGFDFSRVRIHHDAAAEAHRQVGWESERCVRPSPTSEQGGVLPAATRNKMERSFGADFSQVRVHEGPHVRSFGAVAFTHGSELHFAPGKYRPGTESGDRLIGHELSHVVQQRRSGATARRGKDATVVNDASMEAEADRHGDLAAQGKEAGSIPSRGAAIDGVQLQKEEHGETHLEGHARHVMEGGLAGPGQEPAVNPTYYDALFYITHWYESQQVAIGVLKECMDVAFANFKTYTSEEYNKAAPGLIDVLGSALQFALAFAPVAVGMFNILNELKYAETGKKLKDALIMEKSAGEKLLKAESNIQRVKPRVARRRRQEAAKEAEAAKSEVRKATGEHHAAGEEKETVAKRQERLNLAAEGVEAIHAQKERSEKRREALPEKNEGEQKEEKHDEGQLTGTRARDDMNFELNTIHEINDIGITAALDSQHNEDGLVNALEALKFSSPAINLNDRVRTILGPKVDPDKLKAGWNAVADQFELQLYKKKYIDAGAWTRTTEIGPHGEEEDVTTELKVPLAVWHRVLTIPGGPMIFMIHKDTPITTETIPPLSFAGGGQ